LEDIPKDFMPEGPSIVILKEAAQPFVGEKVVEVSGNRKIDLQRIQGQTVQEFISFGKQILIRLDDFTIRIHLLLFGTYRINERKETPARLSLIFNKGEINFYGCSVNFIEEELDQLYDWSADVMSDAWDPEAAIIKLEKHPHMMVCDALLNQDIFAGSGNIIKNEVLYRIRVHPETLIGNLPQEKLEELVAEARNYSFDFLRWKKQFELKKHWLAHTRKTCIRCDLPFSKMHLGKTNRRSFFCVNCQIKY
jgi:endonuclease-8